MYDCVCVCADRRERERWREKRLRLTISGDVRPNSAVNQPIMKALVFCILTKNFGGPTEWGVGGRSSSALLWLKEEL